MFRRVGIVLLVRSFATAAGPVVHDTLFGADLPMLSIG